METEVAKFLTEYDLTGLDKSFVGLHGKMGAVLFFFLYARQVNEAKFIIQAENLIDEVVESNCLSIESDFYNDITGIGWAFEYLNQHQFIQIDTDEILSEIDNGLLGAKLQRNAIHLNKTVFDYGIYFLMRSRNFTTLPLLKRRYLSFLVEEIEFMLFHQNYHRNEIPKLNHHLINSLFFFLIESYKLNINAFHAKKVLLSLSKYFNVTLSNSSMKLSDSLITLQLIKDARFLTENDVHLKKPYQVLYHIVETGIKDLLIKDEDMPRLAWNSLMYNIDLSNDLFSPYLTPVKMRNDMEIADKVSTGIILLLKNKS